MHWEDYICKYLVNLKPIQTDCYDIRRYRCTKFNCVFDEFHDKCEECEYDTSNVYMEGECDW